MTVNGIKVDRKFLKQQSLGKQRKKIKSRGSELKWGHKKKIENQRH